MQTVKNANFTVWSVFDGKENDKLASNGKVTIIEPRFSKKDFDKKVITDFLSNREVNNLKTKSSQLL